MGTFRAFLLTPRLSVVGSIFNEVPITGIFSHRVPGTVESDYFVRTPKSIRESTTERDHCIGDLGASLQEVAEASVGPPLG